MRILVDSDSIVIDIVDKTTTVSNGIQVSKNDQVYIYAGSLNLVEHDVSTVPNGVCAQKYLYAGGEFVLNPNYVESE